MYISYILHIVYIYHMYIDIQLFVESRSYVISVYVGLTFDDNRYDFLYCFMDCIDSLHSVCSVESYDSTLEITETLAWFALVRTQLQCFQCRCRSKII